MNFFKLHQPEKKLSIQKYFCCDVHCSGVKRLCWGFLTVEKTEAEKKLLEMISTTNKCSNLVNKNFLEFHSINFHSKRISLRILASLGAQSLSSNSENSTVFVKFLNTISTNGCKLQKNFDGLLTVCGRWFLNSFIRRCPCTATVMTWRCPTLPNFSRMPPTKRGSTQKSS